MSRLVSASCDTGEVGHPATDRYILLTTFTKSVGAHEFCVDAGKLNRLEVGIKELNIPAISVVLDPCRSSLGPGA